jgi:hypothetical protein
MDPELRRRLDALLLLASVIVGAEVADLFAASGNDLVLFAAIPTVLAAVLSLSYVYAADAPS